MVQLEILVGMDKAYLSTDGRYFLQAEQQLDKDDFELIKQSDFTPEIVKWLWKNAKGKTIAVDPAKLSYKSALELLDILNSNIIMWFLIKITLCIKLSKSLVN